MLPGRGPSVSPGLGPRYVDPGEQHFGLLTERQRLRLVRAFVPAREVHHRVSMPIRERVQRNEAAHQNCPKATQPAFRLGLQASLRIIAADVRACCPSPLRVGRAVLCAPRAPEDARNARVIATSGGAQRSARPTFWASGDLGNTPVRRL